MFLEKNSHFRLLRQSEKIREIFAYLVTRLLRHFCLIFLSVRLLRHDEVGENLLYVINIVVSSNRILKFPYSFGDN